MPKFLEFIIAPFAIAFLAVWNFISGKPNEVLYIADQIEKALDTKVNYIEIGSSRDIKDKSHFFHTQLLRKPQSFDKARVIKALNLPGSEIGLTQIENKLVVFVSIQSIEKMKARIRTFPNIWQRLQKKILPKL
jgi:hypothetical protein